MFFTQANQGDNSWWKYLIGVVLTVFGLFLGQIPLAIAIWIGNERKADELGQARAAEMMESMDFEGLGIGNNFALILLILSFAVGLLSLWFAVKYIHERPFRTVISRFAEIRGDRILFGFLLWIGLTAGVEALTFAFFPDQYEFAFDKERFLPLMLIAILFLPIQTTFEEIFTRGYLMQAFGLAIGNKWAPLIITTIIFASLHVFNPEVEKYGIGLMLAYYCFAGLVLGLMTILDDSLELAIGVHAATNIYAAVFVSYEGSALQTDALFKTSEINMGFSLILLFGISVVFLLIAGRKYQWTNVSGKLFGPIQWGSDPKEIESDEIYENE